MSTLYPDKPQLAVGAVVFKDQLLPQKSPACMMEKVTEAQYLLLHPLLFLEEYYIRDKE